MYIHSYQIHNVLNDYRKQLSHGASASRGQHLTDHDPLDQISISKDGQRQTIMERISAEIVARITEHGPEDLFDAALAERFSDRPCKSSGTASDEPSQFKYTVIDENNQKQTHTLTIQQADPSYRRSGLAMGNDNGHNMISGPDTQQGK